MHFELKERALEIRQRVLEKLYPHQAMQDPKRITRYSYSNGPMYYLGQQICRVMQDSGAPARIQQCYRPPEEQERYFRQGTSKARAYQSAHQFYEAVDILHPGLMWAVDEAYWDKLSDAVSVIEDRFKVKLVHGWRDWGWDGPHVQLPDWKSFRAKVGRQVPTPEQLEQRFEEVLPQQWKQFTKSKRFATRRG